MVVIAPGCQNRSYSLKLIQHRKMIDITGVENHINPTEDLDYLGRQVFSSLRHMGIGKKTYTQISLFKKSNALIVTPILTSPQVIGWVEGYFLKTSTHSLSAKASESLSVSWPVVLTRFPEICAPLGKKLGTSLRILLLLRILA